MPICYGVCRGKRILPVTGAIECLFAMGFVEDGEHLTLPSGASLHELRWIQKQLAGERLKAMSQTIGHKLSVTSLQASEITFYQKLKSSADHVLMYEDRLLQQQARDVIPFLELNQKAEEKCLNQAQDDGERPLDKRDFLLLELLKWFKTRFFTWTNSPKCDSCNGRTSSMGMLEPSIDDLRWGASRVEGYRCTNCNRAIKFPRYNHPGKLLETRTGRCGEWANCFTLCCRAVGFEARHVVDWTDHVWTEVFSQSQQRWVHCDSCENVCDKPMLYEKGWGKKLSYMFAFSCEEVVDVSWRYTAKPQDVLSRRTECREDWLIDSISKLNQQRQQSLASTRRAILEERASRELVEFLSSKAVKDGEGQGRVSGSVAWRVARGETRRDQATNGNVENYTYKLTSNEKAAKLFHLRYTPARNVYIRVSDDNKEMQEWDSAVHTSTNIQRKEEFDWEMVYLARQEGSPTASISWKMDFDDSGLVIDQVTIKACSQTFQTGHIEWTVCGGDDVCVQLSGGAEAERVSALNGSKSINLKASLSGGQGDVAWQHTQLFRMGLNDHNTYPFEIVVHLREQ
ncbi:peptide-N(4)-(N-acetyl-beta-glucosaminyl)asparagine amidase-like isoform X2 [Amphiura filiformis]|uniref:peptide-N(4)-(N-acetyl-beta- glucosaminyl)asparagine amidase-like isoform X2 n=1 Tax=Amphiura filiformis TaxID=82378 RepID=UPI003B226D08